MLAMHELSTAASAGALHNTMTVIRMLAEYTYVDAMPGTLTRS